MQSLRSVIKNHVDDFIMLSGLAMVGVGFWGITGNLYIASLSIGILILAISITAMILRAGK